MCLHVLALLCGQAGVGEGAGECELCHNSSAHVNMLAPRLCVPLGPRVDDMTSTCLVRQLGCVPFHLTLRDTMHNIICMSAEHHCLAAINQNLNAPSS